MLLAAYFLYSFISSFMCIQILEININVSFEFKVAINVEIIFHDETIFFKAKFYLYFLKPMCKNQKSWGSLYVIHRVVVSGLITSHNHL